MRFTVAAAVLASTAMAQYEPPAVTSAYEAAPAVSSAYEAPAVSSTYEAAPVVTSAYETAPAESTDTVVSTSIIPLVTSVVYTTKVHTVTQCGPEVTNCPAHSTIYSTETVPAYTTVCPVTEAHPTAAPTYGWGNGTAPYSPPAGTAPVQSSAAPYSPPSVTSIYVQPTGAPTYGAPAAPSSVCPGSTVTAITKSYTTVLTSVEYQTIAVPCPTGPAGAPSGTGVTPPAYPTGPAGNATVPPPAPGAAGTFTGSAIFAAVAGVAALILA
jgi:hypothetical protein